jgi:hypothetical protein
LLGFEGGRLTRAAARHEQTGQDEDRESEAHSRAGLYRDPRTELPMTVAALVRRSRFGERRCPLR